MPSCIFACSTQKHQPPSRPCAADWERSKENCTDWFIWLFKGLIGGLSPFKRVHRDIFFDNCGSKIEVCLCLLEVLEGLERSGRLVGKMSSYFRPDPTWRYRVYGQKKCWMDFLEISSGNLTETWIEKPVKNLKKNLPEAPPQKTNCRLTMPHLRVRL